VQKIKWTPSFLAECILGMQEKSSDMLGNWVWQAPIKNLCDHHGTSFEPPFCHSLGLAHTKPSTLRKPESDTDRGDDTQMKKCKFRSEWLEDFQWLKYDSTDRKTNEVQSLS